MGRASDGCRCCGVDPAEELRPCPQRLWIEDDRYGNDAIPVRFPQKDILHGIPIKERVSQCELADAKETVQDIHAVCASPALVSSF